MFTILKNCVILYLIFEESNNKGEFPSNIYKTPLQNERNENERKY